MHLLPDPERDRERGLRQDLERDLGRGRELELERDAGRHLRLDPERDLERISRAVMSRGNRLRRPRGSTIWLGGRLCILTARPPPHAIRTRTLRTGGARTRLSLATRRLTYLTDGRREAWLLSPLLGLQRQDRRGAASPPCIRWAALKWRVVLRPVDLPADELCPTGQMRCQCHDVKYNGVGVSCGNAKQGTLRPITLQGALSVVGYV